MEQIRAELADLRREVVARGDTSMEVVIRLETKIAGVAGEVRRLTERVERLEGWAGTDPGEVGAGENIRDLRRRIEALEAYKAVLKKPGSGGKIDWKTLGTAVVAIIVGVAAAVQQYCVLPGAGG